MRLSKKLARNVTIAALPFLLAPGTQALADPITSFSSTSVLAYDSAVPDLFTEVFVIKNPLYVQKDNDTSGGTASGDLTYNGTAGTGHAKAEASLAGGTLKSYGQSTSLADTGPFELNGYAFARADFGDSFRAYTGDSPFAWTSGTEVTFSIDLSGIVSTGPGVNDRANASFFLQIFEPGTLDSYAQWLVNGAAFPSDLPSKRIFIQDYALDGDAESFEVLFPVPGTLEVTFMPDGDFDWAAGLIMDTAASGTGTSTADFFSTASFSYTGPYGATTYSASGAFPGTLDLADAPAAAALPAPGTVGLMLAGLVGLGAVRRRRAR